MIKKYFQPKSGKQFNTASYLSLLMLVRDNFMSICQMLGSPEGASVEKIPSQDQAKIACRAFS